MSVGPLKRLSEMETSMRQIATALLAILFVLAPANMQPVQDGASIPSACVKGACFVGN
jgi:hypothetical protein